jgi:hypothetical protein
MNSQQQHIEDLLDDAYSDFEETSMIDLVTASRLANEGYMLGNLDRDMRSRREQEPDG